jgi:two-component system chemotaxis sensor kinase CheA
MNIVVVTADKRQFGLVVDQVHDTEEIVVKPLSKQLKHIPVFAGTTIMGDGHVALILDVLGLAKNAKVVGDASEADGAATSTNKVDVNEDRHAMLIVQAGKGVRGAIPLAAVNRLEKFPVTSFEYASGRQVVQYRGGILPLVDLTRIFTGDVSGGDEMKEVVVFNHGETLVGFLVDRVVDIVEEAITPVHAFRGNGIKGSAIIQKQVTDLFDLPGIIESQMM